MTHLMEKVHEKRHSQSRLIAAHNLSSLSAPEFLFYLVIHTEEKTYAEPPNSPPLGQCLRSTPSYGNLNCKNNGPVCLSISHVVQGIIYKYMDRMIKRHFSSMGLPSQVDKKLCNT